MKRLWYFLEDNRLLSFALMCVIGFVAGLTWFQQPQWLRYTIIVVLIILAFCRK